jgi:hypothetical protein
MSEAAARSMTFSAEFRSGYRATLIVSFKGFQCEWSPGLPTGLKPTDRKALLESYTVWRDESLQIFARAHNLVVKTVRVGDLEAIAFCKAEGGNP